MYDKIMMARWEEVISNMSIPECDKADAIEGTHKQFSAEFSHQCYLKMLENENSIKYENVFQSATRLQKLEGLDEEDREMAVLRIIELWDKKRYRLETLHLAI